MSPYPILGCLLLCAACGLGGYRHGVSVSDARHDASRLAEIEGQRKALTATAKAIAAMTPAQDKITERVTHEVKTNTVYRDCVLPAAGVGLLNDAISGTITESAD